MTPRNAFVKSVIREVSGYAPYERRAMELLKNGLDKRALRLLKRKVLFDLHSSLGCRL